MDEYARSHRNAEDSDTLETEDINCKQRIAYSLDLNPINFSQMLLEDVFHK